MATLDDAATDITQTKEFSDCLDPAVRMCISQAANEIARKENSLTVCEKLQNDEEVNSCKYGVIIAELSTENTMSRCDVLNKKYKTECRIASIQLLATTESDPAQCNQIADETFQTSEEETWKNRVDQCKFTIIMQKEDLKIDDCDELGDSTLKQTCTTTLKSRQASSNTK